MHQLYRTAHRKSIKKNGKNGKNLQNLQLIRLFKLQQAFLHGLSSVGTTREE
jgi:hypothetical protein